MNCFVSNGKHSSKLWRFVLVHPVALLFFQPPCGAKNLWDLVLVVSGGDEGLLPSSYSKGIVHIKHLVKYKGVCVLFYLVSSLVICFSVRSFLCFRLSRCRSVSVSVSVFRCLPVSVSPGLYLSLCLSLSLYLCLFASVCLSVSLFVCLFLSVSFCLSLSLPFSLPFSLSLSLPSSTIRCPSVTLLLCASQFTEYEVKSMPSHAGE